MKKMTAFAASDKDARLQGIGTSDAPILMQASKYKTLVDLWAEKTGRVEPEDLSEKESVYWGTYLEEPILRAIPDFFPDIKVRKDQKTYWANEYLYAHLDGRIVPSGDIAEIKNQGIYQAKSWDEHNVPPWYYWQGIAALNACTKAEAWHIFALLGGQKLVHRSIFREEVLNDIDLFKMRAEQFWRQHVIEDKRPEATCESDLRLVHPPEETGGSIIITDAIQKKVEEASKLDSLATELKAKAKELRTQAKISIGSAEVVTDDLGNPLYEYRYRSGRKTVDSKLLKSKYPDVYEDVLKVGEPYRTLSAKKGDKDE